MKRRLFARVAVGAVALTLAIPATALAPAGQYATFNKDNTTITDHQTALQWQRGFTTATSWDDANAQCNALVLGGISGWRLPSVKELLTLVDEAVDEEYVTGRQPPLQYFAIDPRAFPTTPSGSFWAWPMQNNGQAWRVDFATGESHPDSPSNSGFYVRCVHY